MQKIKVFRISIVLTVIWMIVMRLFSPANIVQFEFAGTVQAATEIISDWGADGVSLARISTYLDFIFLALYCWAISLGCIVAAEFSRNHVLKKIGFFLSRLIWLAGICDIIENIAMLMTLQEINQQTVSIAYHFAAVKFTIVFICLLFVLISASTGVITKMKKTQPGR